MNAKSEEITMSGIRKLEVRRGMVAMAALLASVACVLGLVTGGAFGASVTNAVFTGGSGTANSGDTLYAKQGAALTLTVTTDDATRCVEIEGAHTTQQTSATNRATWTFHFTAGAGEGVQNVTATAFKRSNPNGKCVADRNEALGLQHASYVLDNTGPVVTGARSPAPNAAGWSNGTVDISWSASDTGSGIGSGPTPATDAVQANTPAGGVTRSATAADRVGNTGSGSVTVKVDKDEPVVTGSRSPAANAHGWNSTDVTVSLSCSDDLSGIRHCTGGGTRVLDSEGANQNVTATAADNADNEASTSVGPVNIDKAAPSLSGAVAAGTLGENGWYTSDVSIAWMCADALSGIAACPTAGVIAGEGQDLTATASVSDRAGNSTSATGPSVKIDKTAPNTNASAVGEWNNVDVSVTLEPHDGLSGVGSTHYRVDGGAVHTGTSVTLADEGRHSLEYWSVDRAGNAERHKTVAVNIDRTSPTIRHEFSPAANANGWFRDDVSVRFICDDALSGIERCGPDRVVASEGADQDASGTAVDRAGNSVEDPATVSLDRTAPTIEASADRRPNANGWHDGDVTVSFACTDALSGVDSCPASQVLREGADQSASATVADAAGNTATGGLTGVNVDKTPPTLHGAPTAPANGNGWYRDDVVVGWTCSDALSGLAGACPGDSTIGGEGENRSAGASVADRAGNAAHATVDGIRIDRTPPTTTAEVPAPLESGWYAGAVTVTLNGIDSLSRVATTHYRIDGGDVQTYSEPFELADKGVHEIRFWSVDRAGNAESPDGPGQAITLKIDGIAPTIEGRRAPAGNAFGWTNMPVTVSFDCSDAESGIAGCTDPVRLENEGAGQSVDGNARDNAGNVSRTTVKDIDIDLTAPVLSGAPATPANAAGWYRDDVVIRWTATDGLSGVDGSTVPADSTITGEGDDLGAGPVQVSDRAGNVTPAWVSGIRIDRTGPSIDGAPTTSPNGAGWYRGDVVVAFTCADALSGVASCPSDEVVNANGAGQSVTSVVATDLAGNSTPGRTVGPINVDGLAPRTAADNRCTKVNDWCTGESATVVLTAADQPGLSGVKEIRYSVNGGAEQVAEGTTETVSVPLDGSGEATVRFHAVDHAGNVEPSSGAALKYDNIAPKVAHEVTPAPNAATWNKEDAAVRFTARDNDGGSGVDAARTTPDVLVDAETDGRLVIGEAFDIAGNRGTDSVTVRLDKTAPAISGAVVAGQLGESGWYVGPVTVRFTCSDDRSGVAVCPSDVTLTANGSGQSVTREAIDRAGNTAAATVAGIKIDDTKPAIALDGIASGGLYTLGAVPAPSCTATDEGSGAADCTVTVTGGQANGVGTFVYTATATDAAGNLQTLTGSYRVIYRFDGFLQPINDTAHQIGTSTSIFKGGSTVPAKFELKRAGGTVVQANAAPVWLTPAKGSATTAPVDESLYSLAGDGGGSYRWDGSRYHYNWNTSGASRGYYHRIGVKLDDGQIHTVNIGLR
jgi:hypothetical protein